MTKEILIRHGTTDWMEEEILRSSSHRPQSDFSRQQAGITSEIEVENHGNAQNVKINHNAHLPGDHFL